MTLEQIREKYGVPAFRGREVWYTPPGVVRWLNRNRGKVVKAVKDLGGDRVVWKDDYGNTRLADPLHLTYYDRNGYSIEWCAVENRKKVAP